MRPPQEVVFILPEKSGIVNYDFRRAGESQELLFMGGERAGGADETTGSWDEIWRKNSAKPVARRGGMGYDEDRKSEARYSVVG